MMVVARSKVRHHCAIKNGVAHVQAGGGIVADSTPEGEFDESVNKSKALLRALEAAHGSTRKGKGKS